MRLTINQRPSSALSMKFPISTCLKALCLVMADAAMLSTWSLEMLALGAFASLAPLARFRGFEARAPWGALQGHTGEAQQQECRQAWHVRLAQRVVDLHKCLLLP